MLRAVPRCCVSQCCQFEWFLRKALSPRGETKVMLCSPTDELEVAGEHPVCGNHSPARQAVLWVVHSPCGEWQDWDTGGPCLASMREQMIFFCSAQQSGREQGLGTALGCPVRLGRHLMRCIIFSKSFLLLCAFYFPSVFVSNTAAAGCSLAVWLPKISSSGLAVQKEPPIAYTSDFSCVTSPSPPVFKTQMLWWSLDAPQRSNLKSWSDRESVASSGKLFQWLINYLNCSAPRTILFLCRNAFGFQPLDLKMPSSVRLKSLILLLLSLCRHLLTTLKSPLNLPRDRLNGLNVSSSLL